MAAKKAALKKYNVYRRFSITVSYEVEAESFDGAVTKARERRASDFVNTAGTTDLWDYSELPGFGVVESY